MDSNGDKINNILSIDQGTSSTRIAVIDPKLKILFSEQIEHEQIHQNPGWTEHNPIQIFLNVSLLIENLYHKNHDVIKYYNYLVTLYYKNHIYYKSKRNMFSVG
jgi:glycerol kinase